MSGTAGIVILILFALLASGVWVGLALMGTGLASLAIFRSMPVEKLLGQIAYNSTTVPELIALPLFILMAEILFRTELSRSPLSRSCPLDREASRQAPACECARLHAVRRDLRLLCCHRRHGRPHDRDGASAAWL